MRKRNSDEKGQSMVIIALAMVGLIAFVALVIDGGMAFAARRQMQNAADAAALAGLRELINDFANKNPPRANNILAEIYDFAEENGVADPATNLEAYFIDENQDNHDSDPLPGDGSVPDWAVGVEVITSTSFDSFFAVVIGRDKLGASAEAAAIWVPASCGGPYAIWGDSHTCNNTVKVTGSDNTINGAIHSNNDVLIGGSDTAMNGILEYCDPDQTPPAGGITYNPPVDNPRRTTYCPYLPPQFDIDLFKPTGAIATALGDDYVYVNGNLRFPPLDCDDPDVLKDNALYYVTGDVEISCGAVDLTVTIVAEGKIQTSGPNSTYKWFIDYCHYADCDPTEQNELLFFSNKNEGSPKCSDKVIKMSGSENHWVGRVYAPYGQVSFSGSTNSTFEGSIFGYTVDLAGSVQVIGYESSGCDIIPSGDVFLIE